MSLPETPGALLTRLHELRTREFDLSEALSRLPRQLVVHQGKLNKATKTRDENTARLKQLQVDHRAKETQIKQLTQHIDKLETQRAGLSTAKEFEAIDHEVTHERAQIAGLEDEILVILEDIDQRTAKGPELEAAITTAKNDLAEFEKNQPTLKQDLETDLAGVRKQLSENEPNIPREHSATYQRILAKQGHEAFSKVDDRVCLACRTTIDMQSAGKVRRGEFLLCPGCGRMLHGMPSAEEE
ncbi:MAG: zinc ribbon domain-containing protein [Gemmataceae bacterium]